MSIRFDGQEIAAHTMKQNIDHSGLALHLPDIIDQLRTRDAGG
jgi:hypothetical protein